MLSQISNLSFYYCALEYIDLIKMLKNLSVTSLQIGFSSDLKTEKVLCSQVLIPTLHFYEKWL